MRELVGPALSENGFQAAWRTRMGMPIGKPHNDCMQTKDQTWTRLQRYPSMDIFGLTIVTLST